MRGRILTRRNSYLYFVVLGIIIGILITNLMAGTGLCSLVQTDNLRRVRDADYSGWLLLLTILKKRIAVFLLLGIVATAYQASGLLKAILAYGGALSGYIMSSCVISYGLKGIWLLVVASFPQMLLYLPAGVVMVIWCDRQLSSYELSIEQLKILMFILGVVIIGCLTESYVNPILLSKFLKNF